jgi:hypothetical protein
MSTPSLPLHDVVSRWCERRAAVLAAPAQAASVVRVEADEDVTAAAGHIGSAYCSIDLAFDDTPGSLPTLSST